jgi:EAL domain-containing protein (putative c-di-GMP-specific phosphodiesterase class I)
LTPPRTDPAAELERARAPGGRSGPPQEVDAIELARIVEARLVENECRAGGAAPADFALLLVRLERHDGPRWLLPTAPVAALWDIVRARLAGVLQEADRYAVLGTEEVVVFLARVKSPSIVRLAMNRLMRTLTIRFEGRNSVREFHPAIGAAMPSPDTRSAEQLASAADAACAAAAEREDRIHLIVGSGPEVGRTHLVPSLRAAIESNRLEVHYQPQFNFRRRRCTMVEALVRWPRPAGVEPVSAEVLVDLACRHGLIQALTRFVLDTALRETRELARAGIDLGVAVNLAPVLLSDAELPVSVAQALKVWQVAPEALTLEVTEASDPRDDRTALGCMHALRTLGTRLSIDDFGTGFSSLARLRALPLAELKIDRLFVANMNHSSTDLQIVRSVIDLAHNFELNVVAEGVEDAATARHLHALGCDTLQGYLVARPMPAADLLAWWERQPDSAPWMEPADAA